MSLLDVNKTLKVNPNIKEPYFYVSVDLDLSQLPLGTYYFNTENNFNYLKNWFNYNNFIGFSEHVIVEEVLQYGKPEFVPNSLDLTKNYVLESTSLNAVWKAKVVPSGTGTIEQQRSATDLLGNLYVTGSYTTVPVDIYNSSNVLVTTLPLLNPLHVNSYIVKYSPSGSYLWSAWIQVAAGNNDTYVTILDVSTDTVGNVYVAGRYGYRLGVPPNGQIQIFNSNGTQYQYTPGLSLPIVSSSVYPCINGFLIKYSSAGFVQWATRLENIADLENTKFAMSIQTDTLNNIYIATQYGPLSFVAYNTPGTVSTIPALPPADNPYNTILVKYISSGVAQWAIRMTGDNNTGLGNALTIDSLFNVYVVGGYVSLDTIYNAPGQSSNVSSVSPPPTAFASTQWSIQETGRTWKSVASDASGNNVAAVVSGGQIYTSSDGGINWTARDIDRNWYAITSDATGQFLAAVVYGGQIYTSSNYGVTWTARETNRNWNSIASNSLGTRLIATVAAGRLYRSTDFGVTWSADVLPGVPQNWISVSINSVGDKVVAAISTGTAIYRSTDGGANLAPVGSPALNWSGVATNSDGSVIIGVVDGGYIYQSIDSGVTWSTRYFATVKQWNSIYCNNNDTPITNARFIASVNNGQIYLSSDSGYSWNPTNNNRPWTGVACNATFDRLFGVSNGQPIQIGDFDPAARNTYVVKYNSSGQCQWITYCQGGRNEGLSCIFNPQSQSVCITGRYNKNLNVYDSDDFTIASAIIQKSTSSNNTTSDGFLINYNLSGTVTWESKIVTDPFNVATTGDVNVLDMVVDNTGDMYLAGGFNQKIDLYNSTGENATSLVIPFLNPLQEAFLIKYYSNGVVQSRLKLTSQANTSSTQVGTGLGYDTSTDSIYFVGRYDVNAVDIYNSNDTLSPISPLTDGSNNVNMFIVKYSSSSAPSFVVNPPLYNSPFQVQFSVGGGSRTLLNQSLFVDEPVEVWGGQTGYTAGSVTIADLNAGVNCNYGHDPGNTRTFVAGLPSETNKYNFLAVELTEPSFPLNDPQPETSGSVNYGFIPFYISVPGYATGVVFNTQLYNSKNLIMTTTGPVVSGQIFEGLSTGDVIRLLIIDPLSSAQYITLNVKGLIVSDASVLPNVQAGVVFEETTYYVASVITPSSIGVPRQSYAELLPGNYVGAYYQPKVLTQGKINVVVKAYHKYSS